MINLDAIRSDMAAKLENDKGLNSVEVRADTLDEALADAAVQLNSRIVNLEYEVIEKGFEGFMGIAKKPWLIKVYQNPEYVAEVKKQKQRLAQGEAEEEIEVKNLDRDGVYFIHHFGPDICLKVVNPVGSGKSVNANDIINDVKSKPDTISFDEKKIKEYASSGTDGEYKSIGDYNHIPASDAIFVIDIAKDEMKATCIINAPSTGGADVTVNQIKQALTNQGVVAGISDEKIQDLVDNPVFNVPATVAEAVYPVDGRDAYIAYNFETDRSKIRAQEAENGQVNFKELNLIQNVVQGQPLAQKMSAERGKAGKTLYGRYLEAKDGKDINLPLGKNVSVDTDGCTVVAAVNGQVLLVNDKINVEPILELDGVNIKTGNITFLGTVVVKGSVEDGFDIKASGNIEINGAVGKCNLESDGDIIISQGMMGRDEGQITCGGSVWAKFIQNTNVDCLENVIVTDSIMNSNISAQKKIILQGKRAQITGGHLFATETIAAKNIGSNGGGAETILEVGFDPKAKKRLLELQEMQSNNVKELDEVELNIATLENQKKIRKSLPKEKELSLKALKDRKNEIIDENTEHNNEIEKLQARLRELKNIGKVYASGTVYAGVKIYVRDEKDEVRSDTKSVTFYYDNGFVRRGKYEAPSTDGIKAPNGYSSN